MQALEVRLHWRLLSLDYEKWKKEEEVNLSVLKNHSM